MTSTAHIDLSLPSPGDTARLAEQFAAIVGPGDTLLLEGEIGAGKSHVARSLIKSKIPNVGDVPSPTFTLVQTYQDGDLEIWHCDLYRLTHPDEAVELGLLEAFETAVCLVEWPDRMGPDVPSKAVTLRFEAMPDGHHVQITSRDINWIKRFEAIHV